MYEYDATGLLSRIAESAAGSREYACADGRVAQVLAATWTETYAYNSVGDLTHATVERHGAAATPAAKMAPETQTNVLRGSRLVAARGTAYEYDRQGRVVRRTRRTLSGKRRTWEYWWDSQGRLVEVFLPDGGAWSYEYDPIGRRFLKQHRDEAGTVLDTVRFAWDGPGWSRRVRSRVRWPPPGRGSTNLERSVRRLRSNSGGVRPVAVAASAVVVMGRRASR